MRSFSTGFLQHPADFVEHHHAFSSIHFTRGSPTRTHEQLATSATFHRVRVTAFVFLVGHVLFHSQSFPFLFVRSLVRSFVRSQVCLVCRRSIDVGTSPRARLALLSHPWPPFPRTVVHGSLGHASCGSQDHRITRHLREQVRKSCCALWIGRGHGAASTNAPTKLSLRLHSPVPGRTFPVRCPYPQEIPAWTVGLFGPWTGARSSETSLGCSARVARCDGFVRVSKEKVAIPSHPTAAEDA